jgi:hypothetical protein
MTLSKKRFFYLLVAVTGILYLLSIFDFSFIFAHSAYWKEPFGDPITNQIGARYFAQDSWRWPLFYVPRLAFPEGTNIIYTDSIPFLALLAKIIYKITGEWFNYFGFWIGACFPLLGLFIALAIKEAQCKDAVAIVGGILLALACPALLIRFGHAALMGHFLIAWAFFLYLKFKHTPSLFYFTLQFAIVTSLCIVLQTYFLLMVMPFFAAGLLQGVKDKSLSIRSMLISLLIVLGSILLTAFVSGMIGHTGPAGYMDGFGFYSMNMLSPFLPPKAHLPHFIAQHVNWDGNGYSWDATGGQYEGYNYLGAGLLALLLVHSTVLPTLLRQTCKRHLFLLLALLSLFLLALSNRIFLGNWQIIKISLHNNWFSYFRTGGRLFWPIYYVLVVALVVTTFRRFSPRVARIIILGAIVLQLADTSLLHENAIKAGHRGFPKVLSQTIWNPLLANHQFIEQYPSFQCGGWAGQWPENNTNMELLLLAAQQNKPINSAYVARTSRNCMNEKIEASSVRIQKGGLYIFSKQFPMRALMESNHFQRWCREFKFGFICSQEIASLPGLVAFSEFKPFPLITQTVPTYKMGEVLQFTTNGNGGNFLHHGWYGMETWGTWTMGKESDIVLKLAHPQSKNYLMTVYARAFVHPHQPNKQISVFINENKVALWNYHLGAEVAQYTAEIPRSLIAHNSTLRIKFISDTVESPRQAGLSEDQKQISLGLITLSIVPLGAKSKNDA